MSFSSPKLQCTLTLHTPQMDMRPVLWYPINSCSITPFSDCLQKTGSSMELFLWMYFLKYTSLKTSIQNQHLQLRACLISTSPCAELPHTESHVLKLKGLENMLLSLLASLPDVCFPSSPQNTHQRHMVLACNMPFTNDKAS